MMKLLARAQERIFLEDEGRLIGRICLPDVVREKMAVAPMAVLEQSLEERVDVVIDDYVVDLGERYHRLHGELGPALHAEKLQADLYKIRRRLGGDRYQQVSRDMAEAFTAQRACGDLGGHCQWIAFLLQKYYDPMYEYQLQQRGGQVLIRGDRDAVLRWAAG